MAKNTMRIRLKAYEHRILDDSAKKIVEAATKHGAKKVVGPVPLPTEKQVVTILRAVHKYKDSPASSAGRSTVLRTSTRSRWSSLKFVRTSV